MQSRDPARDLSAWLHEHIKALHTVIALDNAYHAESNPQKLVPLGGTSE